MNKSQARAAGMESPTPARVPEGFEMNKWFQVPDNVNDLDDNALCQTHSALQGDLNKLRYGGPMVVLLLIAACVLHLRSEAQAISAESLVSAFEGEASTLIPKLQTAVMDVGTEVTPFIADTLQNQVDNLIARFGSRLDAQMKLLEDTLPKQFEGMLMRQMKEAHDQQIASLVEAFPELKDKPKQVEGVMQSFRVGFTKWSQGKLSTTFNRHLVELNRIKKTLNGIVDEQNMATLKAKEKARKMGLAITDTRVHPEQLLNLWLEVVETAFSGNHKPMNLAPASDKKKAR